MSDYVGRWNELMTGSWHAGPGNTVKKNPDWKNPDDVAAWYHDKGYSKMLKEGKNPYFTYNKYDEDFIRQYKGKVGRNVFKLKKIVMPHGIKQKKGAKMDEFRTPRRPRKGARSRVRRNRSRTPSSSVSWGPFMGPVARRSTSLGIPHRPRYNSRSMSRRLRSMSVRSRKYLGYSPKYRGGKRKWAPKRRYSTKRRRFGRGRQSSTQQVLNAMVRSIAPPRILWGNAYKTPLAVGANLATMFCHEGGDEVDSASTSELIHGSTFRFNQVMSFVHDTTTAGDFDNERRIIWSYSKTRHTITNPTNGLLNVRFYEVVARKKERNTDGPLFGLEEINANTNVFPVNSANVRTNIVMTYVTPDDSAGLHQAQLTVPPWYRLGNAPQFWKQKWKIIRSTDQRALGPGEQIHFTQESRYGAIIGDKFDSGIDAPARFVVVWAQGMLGTDEGGTLHGNSASSLLYRVLTKDVARALPAISFEQFARMDDTVAGANALAYDAPDLATGEVPAGHDNVIVNVS